MIQDCHHVDITAIVEAREPNRLARKAARRARYNRQFDRVFYARHPEERVLRRIDRIVDRALEWISLPQKPYQPLRYDK